MTAGPSPCWLITRCTTTVREPVSADYFGRFAAALAKRIGAQPVDPPFVGIMSQGTSGDQMWMDYGQPKKDPGLDAYARMSPASPTKRTRRSPITTGFRWRWPKRRWCFLAACRTKRGWHGPRRSLAGSTTAARNALPRNLPEVYAKEAIFSARRTPARAEAPGDPDRRAGHHRDSQRGVRHHRAEDQGAKSVRHDDEHRAGQRLGGIHPASRAARAGGLHDLAGSHRGAGGPGRAEDRRCRAGVARTGRGQAPAPATACINGPYAEAVLASRPLAYWRLDDIQGRTAFDSTGNATHASYEGGVAFLPARTELAGFSAGKSINRAVHFAGGRLKAKLDGIGETYSVELWFWNGLPNDLRPITGHHFFVCVPADKSPKRRPHGHRRTQRFASGRLFFSSGTGGSKVLAGKTEITAKTWHHLALVREGKQIAVYLDGKSEPEISGGTDEHRDVGLSCCSRAAAAAATGSRTSKASSTKSPSTIGLCPYARSPTTSAQPNGSIEPYKNADSHFIRHRWLHGGCLEEALQHLVSEAPFSIISTTCAALGILPLARSYKEGIEQPRQDPTSDLSPSVHCAHRFPFASYPLSNAVLNRVHPENPSAKRNSYSIHEIMIV